MIRTGVVIIGGGATGTGILRDLSMRGIPALLVEKADLASGSSSRFHGLLHSGARYAVNDPEAAKECIAENTILRRIGRSCVEETEGYFVRMAGDDPDVARRWLAACCECGIEAAEISVAEARRREPNLSPDAVAVYRVPDSAVDGFRLVWHNVMSARRHGGDVRTYCRVTGIETENGRVAGVALLNAKTGEKESVHCDFVINATGSWAGEVAALAGLSVPVTPDRGTLLAFNHRFTGRVINRLRQPGDGDIFVPHGSIVIFGTTSIATTRPDDTTPTSGEVLSLIALGEPLFPKIRDYRILRAFAGTRPLYTPDASTGRAATRNFVLIDHAAEGLSGMITITGGKLTSYRLMAEKTADAAARHLGVTAPCRTAHESILPDPGPELAARAKSLFPVAGMQLAAARLGDGLERAVRSAEQDPWKKLLLCECELVTLSEFETVAAEPTSHSLGDIRRRTRLGMGTCQGSFCALRAMVALAENALLPGMPPQDIFRQFLQERWHGIRPLLWGDQLREVELERGIYEATLNINGTVPAAETLTAEPCPVFPATAVVAEKTRPAPRGGDYDLIVAGAGFAGLTAAAMAAARGKHVLVISRGAGALTIGGGGIDLLGYTERGAVHGNPFAAMRSLPPSHPYAVIGEQAVRDALAFLGSVLAEQGCTLLQAGSEQGGNAWMPTSAGSMKPVWLTGAGMNPHSLAGAASFVVLGVTGMKDFSPRMAAEGLRRQPRFAGKTVEHMLAPSPFSAGPESVRDATALDLARFLDTEAGIAWLAGTLARLGSDAGAVLIPCILGTRPDGELHAHLERVSGRAVIELICPPPSVTGLRMQNLLMRHLRGKGVHFVENAAIAGYSADGASCRSLITRPLGGADKECAYSAKSFIVATGGLFSKGVLTGPGEAHEAIFKLPLHVPAAPDAWSHPAFFSDAPHPFALMGVTANERLQAVGPDGKPFFTNVHFAGRVLGGYDHAVEKSGSGVALATGCHAGTLA
jgi:glycerol-3-phosphate dehydrogenase